MILYILNRHDATIYKIKKLIDELFFAHLKSSIGTISPALKRLEKLGCVEYSENMSDGGMKTKTYSLTMTGKEHLVNLLTTVDNQNPYHILQTAKIAIFCSDILSINEMLEFKENLKNQLELFKIKLEKGLKNEYLCLGDIQKTTVQITLKETSGLLEML